MRSNNESVGLSAQIAGKENRFYYKANLTLIDYADYKVPADSIQYYSYYIRLKDRRLRNTAGKEHDGSFTLGYAGDRFSTDLKVSDAYAKSGFFADAHGLEVRLSEIDYDRSRRDIDLPYHQVNHLKVMNHSEWRSGNIRWEAICLIRIISGRNCRNRFRMAICPCRPIRWKGNTTRIPIRPLLG